VIGVRRRQAELAEDVPDVLLDGPLRDHENPGDRAVGPAFGHQRQHITLPGRQGAEPEGAAAGAEQLGHDFRVEGGTAGRDPAQRLDEFTDVGDPVLEQVPDTCGPAAGRRAEQVGSVPGLDVLEKTSAPVLG
jgi:hypothetical protein